ncbi:MAG: peptidoglycan DD-metalloendopeptidase family protein [Clostridiales bacterium]|nr:peptidoglycan DD-metalloendopeptidase family protein [Clostridiales bacterium]
MLIRLEITGYVIWKSIVSFGKSIVTTFAPAVDRRAGGSFSFAARTVFGVVTLEGPRLMLISRYRAARMERKTKVGLSAIGGTAVAAIVVATVLIGSQLIAVMVDGRIVGYVENEEQYASLLQQARERISEQVGTESSEIVIQDTIVSLEPVIAPQQQPLTTVPEPQADGSVSDAEPGGEESLMDAIIDLLIDDDAVKATLYTIIINGKEMATLSTMVEASDVLKAIVDYYMPVDGEYTGEFMDDVVIEGIKAELNNINTQNPEDVIDFLLAGETEERLYVATEDDSAESIAEALGIGEHALRAAYPDYNFLIIEDGDVFTITVNNPYINYSIEGHEIVTETIEYETIEEDSPELFLGQRETKEEGEEGERLVTYFVTWVNGEIASKVEAESEVIREPKPEVVFVGTQMVRGEAYVGPSDGWGGGGDGPLGRPLNSWYLSRSIGGGHFGADMLAPRGTPIFAAAHGTVSFSGWYGGYGNLVILDHGNGLQTYYAHCDTLNVSVGQTVERGQQIATVGTTGRSTAYHLHFEVRINGSVQDPLQWIS